MRGLDIEKGRPEKLLFGAEADEWQTLDNKEAFRIAEALADPLRQWVYEELGKGPLRQAELAKRASDFFKKKITNVLMRYHLQHLQKAGLVNFETDSSDSKRVKEVHLTAELRIQLKPFAGPEAVSSEELTDEISKVFKGRRK